MRRLLLSFSIIILVALPLAKPAHALCCTPWGPSEAAAKTKEEVSETTSWTTQFAKWAKNFEFFASIINLFDVLNDTIHNDIQILGAGLNAGQKAQAEMRTRTAEALVDTNAQTSVAATQARITSDHLPPAAESAQLCNMMMTRQANVMMPWYSELIATQISELIGKRYRGVGMDGNGPQYGADVRKRRCDNKVTNKIEQFPEECRDKTPNPLLVDADLTLREGQVFQSPPVVEKKFKGSDGQEVSIKVPTPDPDSEDYNAQRLWVAAVDYCFHTAGPRPTPPNGKDLDSPEGMTAIANFNHALALESAFVKQCANRVAKLTRPNCSDPAFTLVCAAGGRACTAAQSAGVALPAGVDCKKGLSLYQAEHLSRLVCTTDRRYIGGTAAGAGHGNLAADSTTSCALSMAQWNAQLAQENSSLNAALEALRDMQAHYMNTAAPVSKTQKIRATAPLTKPSLYHEAAVDAELTSRPKAVR